MSNVMEAPNEVALQCGNETCKKQFNVKIPKGYIQNGTPFCTVVYGQPPVQCPFCQQTYIFQLVSIEHATFTFLPVQLKEKNLVDLAPAGMKIPPFKM